MATLPNVNISLANGSLGNQPTNTDYIRGVQFYGTAPGTFATTACQAITSLPDAVTKGITNNYADETKATGSYLISAAGATGDTIKCVISIPVPVSDDYPTGVLAVDTGLYTVASGVTTIAAQGAAWAAVINSGTFTHGFSASFTTATLTITAKTGLGIALNSGTPIAITLTGTFAGTITQFSGGAYSKKAIWYYHVSEFFRMNPNGKLWINFAASPTSTFTEVTDLITKANGECLMVGVYSFTARTVAQVASDLTALQAIAVLAFAAYNYVDIVYTPNIAAVSDLTTLINLQAYTNRFTACCIHQDGGAVGAQLFINSGVSVGAIGTLLGTSSKGIVAQNIGDQTTNNISNGTEHNVPAFANGTRVNSVSASLLDTINIYRYIFANTVVRFAGTYFSDDWGAVVSTDDYNCISRVLPILKVARGAYAGVVPYLKSVIYFNTDGTITSEDIEVFKSAIKPYLEAMKGVDISDYAINIDAAQKTAITSRIDIVIKIIPAGMVRFIDIVLSYTTNL